MDNKNKMVNGKEIECLYTSIRNVLIESKRKTYSVVNMNMVFTYWSIGK